MAVVLRQSLDRGRDLVRAESGRDDVGDEILKRILRRQPAIEVPVRVTVRRSVRGLAAIASGFVTTVRRWCGSGRCNAFALSHGAVSQVSISALVSAPSRRLLSLGHCS